MAAGVARYSGPCTSLSGSLRTRSEVRKSRHIAAITDPYSNRGWKFLALILGPLASLAVAVLAVWSAVRFFHARRYVRAGLCIVLGVLAVASWWGAGPLARRWSGWSDSDDDGMFGDFINGAYDSVDFYGGHWGVLVLAAASTCGAGIVAIRWWSRRHPDSTGPTSDTDLP